jgi:hypothetical protein
MILMWKIHFGFLKMLRNSFRFRTLSRGEPSSRALWPHSPLWFFKGKKNC